MGRRPKMDPCSAHDARRVIDGGASGAEHLRLAAGLARPLSLSITIENGLRSPFCIIIMHYTVYYRACHARCRELAAENPSANPPGALGYVGELQARITPTVSCVTHPQPDLHPQQRLGGRLLSRAACHVCNTVNGSKIRFATCLTSPESSRLGPRPWAAFDA